MSSVEVPHVSANSTVGVRMWSGSRTASENHAIKKKERKAGSCKLCLGMVQAVVSLGQIRAEKGVLFFELV